LNSNVQLKSHVPKTLLFSKDNLRKMLHRFNTIYFKPTNGSGGINIVRIKKTDHQFIAQHNTDNKVFHSQNDLYYWLKAFAGNRSFILQKGIALAKTNVRPFDIRVMVQKTKKGKWKTTALVCKVGQPGKVVTNYHQGGESRLINSTLKNAGYNNEKTKEYKKKLRHLGVRVARTFSRHNKGFKELGLDVALDQNKRIWILEVNTRPQIYPLKELKNKSVYNKIIKYAKHYGRTK